MVDRIYLKMALEESKRLLDFYIEHINESWDDEQIASMQKYIEALNAGCGCDSYNGFDCRCGVRANAAGLGMEALNKLLIGN